ncbi:MAG: hypothetical protein ABJG88_06505 [Litorimonas sp.]
MSNLFRKEALNHRSRALYGEVVLRAPPSTWIITGVLSLFMLILCAGLFFLHVPTDNGPITLLNWLRGGAQASDVQSSGVQ